MDIRELEERFLKLEKRVSLLEQGQGLNGEVTPAASVLEMDLTLPKADINGLTFTIQQVHAVFEKKEDGWYHSRDILFLSARNTKDDNSRDILMKYFNLFAFKGAIAAAYNEAMKLDINHNKGCDDIEVSLPKKNEGIKKYNGVDWWYWLSSLFSSSAASFANVSYVGYVHGNYATAVGGCALAFRVA